MNTDKGSSIWLSSSPWVSVKSVAKKTARLFFMGLASLTIAQAADFAFSEATIDSLQARLAAGTLTSRELTAAYLARIAAIDKGGPAINAVIELNPDALAIAGQLDGERQAGRVRGPLHGIPVLIKDNIATADRMETTAGSLALVGAKPPREAAIVARLRAAGAVILGKTNMSEWANYRSTNSISGWSGRGGQTRNPYALDRNPSGSSSGSAVAVTANLCVVAVGTETNGSIMSPASVNGVVGVKPTVGLVSRTGIIPIAASLDTAGPMARTVRDAALLLEAISGPDESDAVTQTRPTAMGTDFAANLPAHALKGARLGLVRGPFGFRPNMEPVVAAMVDALRAAGAEVIDLGEVTTLRDASEPSGIVLSFEFKDGLNAYLATLGPDAPVKSLADLIAFNEAHRGREMPLFAQELLLRSQGRGPLTDQAYLDALATAQRVTRKDGIDALMDKHNLDALVALTTGPAALTDPVNGGYSTGSSSSPAAVAGYPSVTVPAAQVMGLPVGFSFFGRAWSEAKLLALAADFEAHTRARREPQFLPTVRVP